MVRLVYNVGPSHLKNSLCIIKLWSLYRKGKLMVFSWTPQGRHQVFALLWISFSSVLRGITTTAIVKAHLFLQLHTLRTSSGLCYQFVRVGQLLWHSFIFVLSSMSGIVRHRINRAFPVILCLICQARDFYCQRFFLWIDNWTDIPTGKISIHLNSASRRSFVWSYFQRIG